MASERSFHEKPRLILQSKRANLYYLEKCRVMQKDGRVLFLSQAHKANDVDRYFNIPIQNTTFILLGIGTSITQAAMRLLAGAGVMVGFCGNGGSPLLAGTEIEWLSPQNEYRPTKYVQGWLSFWYDDEKRLQAAKAMQFKRCDFLEQCWENDTELADYGLYVDDDAVQSAISSFRKGIKEAGNVTKLLNCEALYTKSLYKYVASNTEQEGFVRDPLDSTGANRLLTHGNYLAYGLGAVVLWTLGIPHAFAVMHGKTRRGALVFDVADLVKDALILPWAFVFELEGRNQQEFREHCIDKFVEQKALDFMFNTVEKISLDSFDAKGSDSL